jgi:hypothetical protein
MEKPFGVLFAGLAMFVAAGVLAASSFHIGESRGSVNAAAAGLLEACGRGNAGHAYCPRKQSDESRD